jgi:4-hydroxyphenylpyruvate dioxygenase-like putative hemolysin
MTNALEREAIPAEASNTLGINGIEFIEFATSKPQPLGGLLEQLGFRLIARHRSREVELYRLGSMNTSSTHSRPISPHRASSGNAGPGALRFAYAMQRPHSVGSGPGRLDAPPRAGHGAQHPGYSWCRREPHLFCRSL